MKLERIISFSILLTALALVTVGPWAREAQSEQGCEALEELEPAQIERLLDELIAGEEPLDAAALERHGAGHLPTSVLPCLEQRLQEKIASAPTRLSLRG